MAAKKKTAPAKKKTVSASSSLSSSLSAKVAKADKTVKTPRADESLLNMLTGKVAKIAVRLPKVDKKKMFGCDAFFNNGYIFALVWKTGRIGVKLTDAEAFGELKGATGTEPWKAGPKEMANWLLVPIEFHSDDKTLAKWVERAHRLAASA